VTLTDPIIYVRAVHFGATLMAAGIVFFIVFVGAPSFRAGDDKHACSALRRQLSLIALLSLTVTVISGAAWLVLTAASISDQPPTQVFSGGVAWTVLSQTSFGWDWMVRLLLACLLAVTFVPLLSGRDTMLLTGTAAVMLAATLAGTLAWAGHAAGGLGAEGIIHPAADFLHLIAAVAWVGTLIPLALLLGAVGGNAGSLAIARTATLRFSTLGLVSVTTLLVTGSINTWYLAGSVPALVGTPYGQLLLAKVALFFGMVAIAALNRLRFTPRLVHSASKTEARNALRQLRRNAAIEMLAGAAIICIVAVLGTEPPASHAHQHASYEALPPDAAFIHIHSEQGMADVTITPGHPGMARATIRLWNENFEPLVAREVTFALTVPAAGSTPVKRFASQDSDGAWKVDGVELSQPGNWMVTVGAVLGPSTRLVLEAPIVIEPSDQ
jgi:putative copper resistance protein D